MEKMKMEKQTLRQWISNFNKGLYDEYNRKTQIEAGWFDWFCRDSSLRNKTYKLGRVVKQIKDGGKVDLDKNYVFFKNNCPLNGPLYDDFRICSIENGNLKFTVQFGCCWNKSKYAVYGRTPDGEGHWENAIFETNSSRELVKWLNRPWEE
jgi:hypothetical protein